MQKFLAFVSAWLLISGSLVSTAEARTRTRTPARTNVVYVTVPSSGIVSPTPTNYNTYSYNSQTGQAYYYSEYYQSGYTYYSGPKPGYYYYFTVPNTQNSHYYNQGGYVTYTNTNPGNGYYTPQNYAGGTANVAQYTQGQYYYPQNYPYTTTVTTYPGCTRADITIGGQVWSGCNSTDRNTSTAGQSGWFFGGDTQSTFLSYNGMGKSLSWQGKQTRSASWTTGPCASGYRLPTRGEWETAIWYARQNSTSLASLLSLSYNGAYYGYRDSAGNVSLSARADVNGAYWTSSVEGSNPTVLHFASNYAGYRTDGTDYSNTSSSYRWQYSDTGLSLVQSDYSEIANVRCIKK
jgi:uncharacterized protein (TIGR02145 family)